MKDLFNETSITIRSMEKEDILDVTKIHTEAFPRQNHSLEWISSNFNAFPRIRYYLAETPDGVVGYIQWIEKSGFRKEVILELEQIAVLLSSQGKGIGTALISQSLPLVAKELEKREASIKHIVVSTRTDNQAQHLYTKTLKAYPEVTISNLFSADEVIMISRNFSLK
jgi:ribosomal protein S18 acetylase RimI-like enzyme